MEKVAPFRAFAAVVFFVEKIQRKQETCLENPNISTYRYYKWFNWMMNPIFI